jgi:hypothetical protein
VPGGTFIHSAIALAPGAYVLALEGIDGCVAWVAARRRTWDRAAAERVFTTAAVGFALVAAVAGSITTQAVWSGRRDDFRAVGEALDAAGAPGTDRVMSIDASGTRYWTGRGGVVLVNDPLDTVAQVARAYDIRWLVVNRADSVAAVSPLLAGVRPPWVGAPILSTADDGGEPRLAVFPVCTIASDVRCAGTTP